MKLQLPRRRFLNGSGDPVVGFLRGVLGLPSAFTLIELLVVISIISILASMLLPSLSRGKDQARMVQCINNLRQMGFSIKLYTDDFSSRFPVKTVFEANGNAKYTDQTLGGNDPTPDRASHFPSAAIRPLYGYMKPSPVYRCPVDKGQKAWPPISGVAELAPSNWETIGCSYQYNAGGLIYPAGGGFRQTPADPEKGLAGKKEEWVPSPEKYIQIHEPPARVYQDGASSIWYQWHFVRGPTVLWDPRRCRQDFISPVLFVDGHAAKHDFSKALSTDPYHPYEPTANWIWYKPND